MKETRLKYGQSELYLRKSERYVGLKPMRGQERHFRALTMATFSASQDSAEKLGGFGLFDAEAAGVPMEETLDDLRENTVVDTGTHVFHSSDDDVPWVPTGRIFVAFKKDSERSQVNALLMEQNLQIVDARNPRELIVKVTRASANPVKTADSLQRSSLVEFAEPDLATPGYLYSFALPNDSLLADQWHLRNTGRHRNSEIGFVAGADARVVTAWEAAQTLGSAQVIVAVIDDGFDLEHPDLLGMGKIVAPRDFRGNDEVPSPDLFRREWHGTACAGIAVGNANGTGIVGAAPHARLMPVRWGWDLSDASVEAWFDYVTAQGAWVVSCSWGGRARNFPLSEIKHRAIERCARNGRLGKGCVICFAVGNDGRDINKPAAGSVNGFAIHPDVIAVGASTSLDELSDKTNFGNEISVCAPSSGRGGWGLLTTDVSGQYSRNGVLLEAGYTQGPYYFDFEGTSGANPLVAGICALILSINPDLTAREVKSLIERTARKIGRQDSYDDSGHSREFGFGCIDAETAVRELLGGSD
jgi:subtilisin family serine protease